MATLQTNEKPKAVALLSGGLDSTLAIRTVLEQGVEVTAVAFKTPFCDFDCGKSCGFKVKEVAQRLGVKLKVLQLGKEYLEIVRNPKHGYGRGMNPCVDCRTMMFSEAKRFMEEVGASFLVTGEVLDQRPMSQTKRALKIIEEESKLEGRVLRPLSAKHLEPTIPEKAGYLDREALHGIKGRSRKEQIGLAERFGIRSYPNSAGGCVLTERGFARKVRDLLEYYPDPDLNDTELLKVGRHFRLSKEAKLVVGRDEKENERLNQLAEPSDLLLECVEYVGPLAILRGKSSTPLHKLACGIVARYSDAPKGTGVWVGLRTAEGTRLSNYSVMGLSETELEILRI